MSTFFASYGLDLLLRTWEHLGISLIAAALGIIVAVPLGVLLTRIPSVAGVVIGLLNIVQTIPSFAILAFFIPILGIGKVPAIVALFFYSVLPMLRNTYIGINDVDKKLIEASNAVGMTTWEKIIYVELPMATPVIMAGIRMSVVYLIGWATLASFIGAGGLGDFIFSGLNLYQTELIIAGAIPVTILAIVTDFMLGKLEMKLTPKGLRKIREAN